MTIVSNMAVTVVTKLIDSNHTKVKECYVCNGNGGKPAGGFRGIIHCGLCRSTGKIREIKAETICIVPGDWDLSKVKEEENEEM